MKRKVKKLFGVLFVMFTLVCVMAVSASAKNERILFYNDFKYKEFEDGTLEIVDYQGNAEHLVIPSKIGSNQVKSIGVEAFRDCKTLKSIKIEDGITEIGQMAFLQCENIEKIEVPGSLLYLWDNTFQDTKWYENQPDGIIYLGKIALGYKGAYPEETTLKIKDGTKSIATAAFSYYTWFSEIILPEGLITIGTWAFSDSYVQKINIPGSVKEIRYGAFVGCEYLESVYATNLEAWLDIDIGQNAANPLNYAKYLYFDNLLVKEIVIPENVKAIKPHAFDGYITLKKVTIPDSTISIIGESAFNGCYNLENVYIGNGVKKIESYVFSDTSIETIDIPATVNYISLNAFDVMRIGGVSKLKSINVDENNKDYLSENGVLFNKSKTSLIKYPAGKLNTLFTIPKGVKTIKGSAFEGAKKLTEIVCSDELLTIEYSAFEECSNLTAVSLGKSTNYIGSSAFSETGIVNIIIPKSVVCVESYAFDSCSKLEKCIFEIGDRNLRVKTGAFKNCEKLMEVENISNRVLSICSDSFENTLFFENILNNSFSWVSGGLYIEDILMKADETITGNTIVLKDSTKVIAEDAFMDYNNICTITNPETLISVGYQPFFTLKLKYLPDNLKINSVGIRTVNDWETEIKELYGDDLERIPLDGSATMNEMWLNWIDSEWLISSIPTDLVDQTYYPYSELFVMDSRIKGINTEELCLGFNFNISVDSQGQVTSRTKGIILSKNLEYLHTQIILPSVTFLNKDCIIEDTAATIYDEAAIICGYPGSTAEDYAKKYDRTFFDITDCKHPITCKVGVIIPSCTQSGYTGDNYCQYCGKFVSKGTLIPQVDHSYTEWEITQHTDCTTDGIRTRSCEECELEEKEIYQKAKGHNLVTEIVYEPSCTSWGETLVKCTNCSYSYTDWPSATGHTDSDHDGLCDICNEDLTKDCSCNCHKGGFMGFIWNIINFFQKLFKINGTCDCGVAHY